jgi:hypothetical protein
VSIVINSTKRRVWHIQTNVTQTGMHTPDCVHHICGVKMYPAHVKQNDYRPFDVKKLASDEIAASWELHSGLQQVIRFPNDGRVCRSCARLERLNIQSASYCELKRNRYV